MSTLFNSLIYPLRGSIRFEVDDVCSLSSNRSSDEVRIGATEWRLEVILECSERTGKEKHLGVYLTCLSTPVEEKPVEIGGTYRLINQKDTSRNEEHKWTTVYNKNGQSTGCHTFVKWSELLSDGFVKDDTIVVECDITVKTEGGVKRRSIDFKGERPNEQDLETILKKKIFPRVEKFEEEIDVTRITESDYFTTPVTIFGLRTKLYIKKLENEKEDYLSVYFYLNWEDKSEWWRCKTAVGIRVLGQDDPTKTEGNAFTHLYSKTASKWGRLSVMKWEDLLYSSNGFVKNGKFKIQVMVQILEAYGFDKNTRRGIDKPMRKMTDTVLIVDGKTFNVSQNILVQQSPYFEDFFSSNPEGEYFEIENVELTAFGRFLELIHNVDTDVCEENAEGVLKLIERFKASECFERLDMILRKQEWKDAMKVLELVDKYPLPELKRKFLLKLKDKELLKSITHSPRYKFLSADMKVAILEWKLIPEESRTEDIERSHYQFSTDFEVKTNLTDVEMKVNWYTFFANKQILANSSVYFMKRFYGPYSEDTPKISIFDVSPLEFEKLLTHIYHPTRPVTSANLISLLRLAHQFSIPRLMDKCEEYLVLNDSIEIIDKLDYAGKYDLPYLLSACSNLLEKNPEKRKDVQAHQKFSHLPLTVFAALKARGIFQMDFLPSKNEEASVNWISRFVR